MRSGRKPRRIRLDAMTPDGLRVGTWNVSHWAVARAAVCQSLGMDVLAVQETHLAPVPLETAHTTARAHGMRLYHGRPVAATAGGLWGRSCGVGFLAAEAVALQVALPKGAAWRRLHAMRRVHAVRLAPSAGLPLGLLLVSVYAPQQGLPAESERENFAAAMLDLVHSLDMQVPTLLLGDWNGTVCPARDYMSGGRRSPCPLLARLLGPGAPLVDVQLALLGEAGLDWTFRSADTAAQAAASRIDLVLANRAAMAMMRDVRVVTDVRDGGHSPVVVTLQAPVVRLTWRRPRPQLPELLKAPSVELRGSQDWDSLVNKWVAGAAASTVLGDVSALGLDELSTALHASLQELVQLAGGWVQRPPKRRRAFESREVLQLRQQLALLQKLHNEVRRCPALPGCLPHRWTLWLAELGRQFGLELVHSSVAALVAGVRDAMRDVQARLQRCQRVMRAERQKRWREALPRLWRERPGTVYGWLRGESAAWGTTPVLDSEGHQCATVEEVDAAVQQYWVQSVLRRHAGADGADRWRALLESEFGAHIPVVDWPRTAWSAARVKQGLAAMREGASPGRLGIPLALWKSLPVAWHAALARMLELVEAEGRWPPEWAQAFVTMIPKASGGSRPEDQRPITVLDVPYRLWAKAVVQEWASTLQAAYLGEAAFGFRAQSGTLHVVQLLQDLIALQRERGEELWLASFDIKKCYDMLPWWALFGVARRAGVREEVVRAFEAFYHQLRRYFRYGQVDGEPWQATNGAAQGCPASPDLLNLLLEAFHRWARAAGLGVPVGSTTVPSVSYADDVALAARSQAEMETLVMGYLCWCGLLSLEVTKVQLWWNGSEVRSLHVAGLAVETQPYFKMVGVVLGLQEAVVTKEHLAKRVPKAEATAHRLHALALPASITALLWRTTVLPQALYGCEVRNVTAAQLGPLTALGRRLMAVKAPLQLNHWRAPEVLMGPPLGDSALRDPVWEMRTRQVRWLQLVANLPGLVGAVHRVVACSAGEYSEPTPALQTALRAVGWSVARNERCLRAQEWPRLAPELGYPGQIRKEPVDDFPECSAVFTDGSVGAAGGAAAVQPDGNLVVQRHIPSPRSSTHCELEALALAMGMETTQVLTDSLTSLALLEGWPSYSAARILRCADRVEVRRVLQLASGLERAPVLEKVKAHDTRAMGLGHPKALGNDSADHHAKRAAAGAVPVVAEDMAPYQDAVLLRDGSGMVVSEVQASLEAVDWRARGSVARRQRAVLELVYPPGLAIDWRCSVGIFKRVIVANGTFVHPVSPAVVKWVARLRAGCLATRDRLFRQHQVASAACPCCSAPLEDDEHVLFGCPATGTVDWLPLLCEAWGTAVDKVKVPAAAPPEGWLRLHRWQLMAALVPASVAVVAGVALDGQEQFFRRLHLELAAAVAERLRRRQAMIAAAPAAGAVDSGRPSAAAPDWVPGLPRPCPLAAERQLSPRALRALEVARRERVTEPAGELASSSSSSVAVAAAPAAVERAPAMGRARAAWLRERLTRLLREDMVVCPAAAGSTAEQLLAAFETTTGELYSESPGAALSSRVRALAKVMSCITRDVPFDPPLVMGMGRGYRLWSRAPRVRVDMEGWRRREQQLGVSGVRVRDEMAAVDPELAGWLRRHPHLVPTEVEKGESGMALLLLWEIDHGRLFPAGTEVDNRSATLSSFCRRLRRRVAEDDELQAWLQVKEMQGQLAPGVPERHHLRWSVRVKPPQAGEPREWYDEFVTRWRAYLASVLEAPTRGRPAGGDGPAAKKRRTAPPTGRATTVAPASETVPAARAAATDRSRARPRSPSAAAQHGGKRACTDLRGWLRPATQVGAGEAVASGHGRATSGSST